MDGKVFARRFSQNPCPEKLSQVVSGNANRKIRTDPFVLPRKAVIRDFALGLVPVISAHSSISAGRPKTTEPNRGQRAGKDSDTFRLSNSDLRLRRSA